MTKVEGWDEMVEHVASRMEAIAAEMRRSRPDRIEVLHDSRHVVEVPSDKPYVVREDGGLHLFGVMIEFPPGVMLSKRNDSVRDDVASERRELS